MPVPAARARAARRSRSRCGRARRRSRSRRERAVRPRIRPPPTPVPSVSMTTLLAPRRRARLPLADRRRVGVVVDRDRQGRAARASGRGSRRPRAGGSPPRSSARAAGRSARGCRSRAPQPPLLARSSSTSPSSAASSASSDEASAGRSSPRLDRAVAADHRAEGLRPAHVDADDPRAASTTAAWLPYAAGWRRPAERSRIASTAAGASRAGCRRSRRQKPPAARAACPGATARRASAGRARSRRRAGRGESAGDARSGSRSCSCSSSSSSGALLGYLTFRGGVSAANKRLPATARQALAPDKGSLLTNSTSILLLGTDHSLAVSRSGDRHSDSITLLRTDPDHQRLYYLSIPRDLRVDDPGLRRREDQHRLPGRRAAARDSHHLRLHDDPGQPRHRRQLRRVPRPDRQGRRHRRRRPAPDPVQVRLPLRLARCAARAGPAGASRRASSTWTAAARSSTRACARTCSTRPRATSPAASETSRCSRR